jgi:hypothetical protein
MLKSTHTRGTHPNSIANLDRSKDKAGSIRVRLVQPALDFLALFSNRTQVIEDLILAAAAKYPPTLYAALVDDFEIICTPEIYAREIKNSLEGGLDPDFYIEPEIWNLIDPVRGIYQCGVPSEGGSCDRTSVMTWDPSMEIYKATELSTQ